MDTESKEMLREWLVKSLEPVCDADPEVLSKYVLALIQNDPKKEGLRETCVSKLEEFLGDETTPFVSRLFTALETEAYRKTRNARPDDHHHDGESNHHNQGNHPRHHHQDASRRRSRTGSDDDNDDDDRYSKRRRDDDRPYSPRRSGDRGSGDRGYGGRDGGRDGGRGGRGSAGGPGPRGAADWERRRNFPPEWGMPPPGMWGAPHPHHPHGYPHPGGRGGFHPMGGDPFDPNGFNPENAGMMPPPHLMMGGRGQYPYGGPYGGRGRGRGQFYGGRSAGGPPRGEDGMPLGGGADGAPVSSAKTTLRVSNVDPKYVNMTKLSLHFSKFGNVVNVQMRPQYKCAYVQYATEDEAKKAFHSPIPVCNNRFIEVKWAKFDAKDPQGAPSEEANTGEDTASVTTAEGDETATESGEQPKAEGDESAEAAEKDMTPEELRAAALEKGRRVLEEKRELLEKQKQLMKQKEELLKRQLAQQKELLERMSQNPASVSAADKRDLLNKITALSEELKALQPRRDSDPNKLSGLKAELSALEAVAAAGGAPQGFGGRGRGRGGGRWAATQAGAAAAPGGRGFYRGGFGGRGGRGAGRSYSMDNRTTIVKVENLPEEARDASVLEQHFGNFGGIERVVVDEAAPTRGYIKFADRYAGQAALTRGNVFGEARLELSWVEAQDAPAEMAPPTPVAGEQTSGGDAPFQNESSEVPTSA